MFKTKELENKSKYYESSDRGLYVYLIGKGHTDVIYRKYNNRIYWSWAETEQLNDAITNYYISKQVEIMNGKKIDYTEYKVVSRFELVRDLEEQGYSYELVEPDLYDWRRKVYLYRRTEQFDRDFEGILRKYGLWMPEREYIQRLQSHKKTHDTRFECYAYNG